MYFQVAESRNPFYYLCLRRRKGRKNHRKRHHVQGGEMVRYMAENQIEHPEELKHFSRLDYIYDPTRSSEDTYVFVKKGSTVCSLD